MKRLLITFTILGMVGSGGTATADGEPAREGRTVQRDYKAPWLPWAGNCVLWHSSCASIPTYGGEAFLTAKVTDAHGLPVSVTVAANTQNDTLGDEITFGRFCGETTSPIAFDPGAELEFFVGSGAPDASCTPGIATRGTIAATLYGSPPSDAPPQEPSAPPTPVGSPTPSPTAQPEKVERSVHLALRGHLRSEGTVSSDDGSCRSDVTIVIQRKRSADWLDVGSTMTDSDGAFALKLSDRADRYRAVAPEVSSPERTCLAAASPTMRHRH